MLRSIISIFAMVKIGLWNWNCAIYAPMEEIFALLRKIIFLQVRKGVGETENKITSLNFGGMGEFGDKIHIHQ